MRHAISRIWISLFLAIACGGSQRAEIPTLDCGNGTQLIGNACIALPPDSGLSCGAGTVQSGGQCILDSSDAGVDGGTDAGVIAGLPVGDDAGTFDEAGSQSTNAGIDAAHHNAQPFDAVTSPLTPIWTLHLGGAIALPLIVHGLAVVAAGEPQPNLRAVDVRTGKLVWGPVATGLPLSIAYEGGSIFGLDGIGNLIAFDALSGRRLWAARTESLLDTKGPVLWGGLAYVTAAEGATYAFDERDGSILWIAATQPTGNATVAAGGGVVYEADGCHTLSAFAALTGNLNWTHGDGCASVGGLTPAVYQDAIWERDLSGTNVIVGLAGEARGQFESAVMPAFHSGIAFYLASANFIPTVSAVEIATGRTKWSFSGNGDNFLCSSPVVAGVRGQVFVASSGNVYELDEATGAVRSMSKASSSIVCGSEGSTMALGEGHLLVLGFNQLMAY